MFSYSGRVKSPEVLLPAGIYWGTYYLICMFPTNSECLIGISDAFSAFVMGIRHFAHMLTVPPTKVWLLCATPTGLDLYIQAMPVGTYRVQSPGFLKIVYYKAGNLVLQILLSYSFAVLQMTKLQADSKIGSVILQWLRPPLFSDDMFLTLIAKLNVGLGYWHCCVCVSACPCVWILSRRFLLNHSTFCNQTWHGGAWVALCYPQGQGYSEDS